MSSGIKRVFSLLLCLLLLLSLLPEIQISSFAETEAITPAENNPTQGSCGENTTWSLDDTGILTITGFGPMADYAVASDAPWYSQRTSIKAIRIGDEITAIGDRAFYNCTAVKEVTIGTAVTSIGSYAFRGNRSLTSVTLPANVTLLKSSAFRACASLTLVRAEGEAPVTENYVFNDGATSRTLQYYDNDLGFDVSPWAEFTPEPMHTGDWIVTVPPTCTTEGSRYIDCIHCNATFTEVMPIEHQYVNNVCTVCGQAFIIQKGCCGPSGTAYNTIIWFLDANGTMTIRGNGPIGDANYWREPHDWKTYQEQITSIVIEEGVTRIGVSAFYGCEHVTSIQIPDSVTEIGAGAFFYCYSLTDINIPESVTKINLNTFYDCDSLRQITIPESVTMIDDCAFYYCDTLTEVHLPESLLSIGEDAFMACYELRDIQIPKNVHSIGESAFQSCKSLPSIVIPSRITQIPQDLFYGCENLTSVTLPDTITSIGDDVFHGCENLTSVTLPDTITSIGEGVFDGCSRLTDITIPNSVTSIGSYAFSDCTGLTEIIISKNVTSIGSYAFSGCTGLTEIIIPKNVTSIGSSAFYKCNNLSRITFLGPAPTLPKFLFSNLTVIIYTPCYEASWASAITILPTDTFYWVGHLYGEYIYNQDATCTKNGTQSRQCPDCGTVSTSTISNSATGHNYETVTIPPSCTTDGSITTGCLNCDDCTVEVLPATGHSYTTETIDPSCTTDGSVTTVCSVCGETELSILPATGHYYTTQIITPSCTNVGFAVTTCTHCGDTQVQTLPTTSHSHTESIKDPTCTQNGTITSTCVHCGSTDITVIPAVGHSYDNGKCLICGATESVPVTVPELKLIAPTLDFKDITCINVFFTAEHTQDVVEMGMITYSCDVSEWNVDNAEYRIPGATYVESTGQYFARSQGIHAQYLGDRVYLACYARLKDGNYVYTDLVSYSPVQYATNQLNSSADVTLKQLVVSMLTYGAAAQKYFSYKTDQLINSGLSNDQLALIEHYNENMVQSIPVVSAEKQGSFANNQGFAQRKPAVSFEGAFCINYFFTPAYAPVGNITLYYWTQEDFRTADVLTIDNATGFMVMQGSGTEQYRADLEGISAKDLSQTVYVAAVYSDGTNTWTSGVLGYSIGAYCANLATQGGTIADLSMATAVYGYHAKAYFG